MKLKLGCSILLSLSGCLWITSSMQSWAQDTPPSDLNLPPETLDQIEEDVPDRIEETFPTPSDRPSQIPIAPEALQDPNLAVPSVPDTIDSDGLPEVSPLIPTFIVNIINVKGNTVLTEAIREITSGYENRNITLEDLFTLRTELTELYVRNGYITSGAFLPAGQDITDGTVDLQIVEGNVEDLRITGLHNIREFYIRDRISLGLNTPFNQQELETALQLLQQNPLFDRISAELFEGTAPGLSVLSLDITEASNFQLSAAVDNYRSPSVGSGQVRVSLQYTNLLGMGDRFNASYSLTEGVDAYALDYTIPVNPTDGELRVHFSASDVDLVEGDFEQLGIVNETLNVSVGFRQPIIHTPTTELVLGIAFDLRESQTFLFEDIPFSFSSGPESGESRVSVIRLSQDWVNRERNRVLAARSQFSVGIDAFDATTNSSTPDGQFVSWLGEFQWVERLPPNTLLVTRVSTQLTPDSLLPLEQFSIGGVNTVRGYRDNQLVTDNGIVGSVELRIPLAADPTQLQITPFIEGGIGWDNGNTHSGTEALASVGVGLQWQITERLGLQIDYGLPLIETEDLGDSLQDSGLYFSINADLFQ